MTEAVAGQDFLLNCISCKKREEVSSAATVDWHFQAAGGNDSVHVSELSSLPDVIPAHELTVNPTCCSFSLHCSCSEHKQQNYLAQNMSNRLTGDDPFSAHM